MITPGRSPATILVVDDDALITLDTVALLGEMGHEAIEAYSGREALDILSKRDGINLMITDYSMPDMTGLQLVAAARQTHPCLRVLLATGYAELPEGEDVDLPRLEKPYREDDLARQINELLTAAG
ncbi:MAG: response regulator [Devosia sp.]|uniref:response regulator n=1 Tax=Devosia sp. TaxID=1871048 RepID=UPI0024CB3349|nr:response regulator [Devosia sp.]UYN99113.1 MAG: response regulator [Devosia sp.]